MRKVSALLARTRNRYARMKTLERKEDTRKKIALGGLVKKAGLAEEPSAVILGLLLEAAELLQDESAREARTRWKVRGDLAFTKDENA